MIWHVTPDLLGRCFTRENSDFMFVNTCSSTHDDANNDGDNQPNQCVIQVRYVVHFDETAKNTYIKKAKLIGEYTKLSQVELRLT